MGSGSSKRKKQHLEGQRKAISDDNLIHKVRSLTTQQWQLIGLKSPVQPKSSESLSTKQTESIDDGLLAMPLIKSQSLHQEALHHRSTASDFSFSLQPTHFERDFAKRASTQNDRPEKEKGETGTGNKKDGTKEGTNSVDVFLDATVTVLSHEIDPVLIAEFVRRRRQKQRHLPMTTDNPTVATPSVNDEDSSRFISRIVYDTNGEEYLLFCDLLRKIGNDSYLSDLLEAFGSLVKLIASTKPIESNNNHPSSTIEHGRPSLESSITSRSKEVIGESRNNDSFLGNGTYSNKQTSEKTWKAYPGSENNQLLQEGENQLTESPANTNEVTPPNLDWSHLEERPGSGLTAKYSCFVPEAFTSAGHFEIGYLYADRESRTAQSFAKVERLKRRKRRKSRLLLNDHVTTIGDSSDRFIPMVSLRLSNPCLCDGLVRRIQRILEDHVCVRDLAIVRTRLDVPTKIRLARALEQNVGLYQLDLGSSSLGNDGAMYLANALRRNQSLRILRLVDNGLNARGCSLLAKSLARNRTLVDLDLGFNDVGDVGCKSFADAIAANCRLRRLGLPSNGIGAPSAVYLFQALKKNYQLQVLDLSANAITNECMSSLSHALITNRTLKELILENCAITGDGCKELSRALKANMKGLRNLQLSGNEIGDEGLMQVADGIQYNRSIEELGLNRCAISDAGLFVFLLATINNSVIKTVNLCHNNITLACRPTTSGAKETDVVTTSASIRRRFIFGRHVCTKLLKANPTMKVSL